METAEVAAKLRTELGWYAWANDIEKERANQSDLADALDGAVREKEDWLKRHTFKSNTGGEASHHTMTLWCKHARALITAMQDEPTQTSTQPRAQERDRG